MSWRELITGVYRDRPPHPGIAGRPAFYPAASAARLAGAEAAVGATLPESLRSLLKETDGVMDMMAIDGGEWFESMWLLWAVGDLVERNCFYRAETEEGRLTRDFRSLVFFAGAGTDGILFAFPAAAGVCEDRVVVWHPILDGLDEVAPSLEEFLRGWLTGTILV